MKKTFFQLAIILFFVTVPFVVWANEYKVTLAKLPVFAVSKTEGVLVDLVKAIEQITSNQIAINVSPFVRSMDNVITGKADFHIPLIKNDILLEKDLPYSFSTETIFHVNFVLYSLKGSGITLDNLSQYKVETDRAHVGYFPFKTVPSNQIIQSLKKLQKGRVDAFIFADQATDPVLKKLGYTNVQRRLYKRFEVKIILPKTENGKQVDKMLSNAIQKLRQNGKFQEIMGPANQPYDNWQP